MSPPDLDRLFAPASIAVVGASADPGRLNGRPVRYLLDKGFPGRIYPVNPHREEILGLPCFPSIAALPEAPDVAYLLLPAGAVAEVVDECGRREVPFVVISGSGFAEVEGGAGRQDDLVALARRNGTAIVGPNCEGIWSVPERTLITFGSAAGRDDIRPGPISVISQSGSLGAGLIQNLLAAGLGVSYFVSTGNEADLDALDFLAYLVERDDTDVIVLFLEGLRGGRRLLEIGRRAAERHKVVLGLKSGVSPNGQQANASHTGKLSSPDRIYDAALRQAGILRLRDLTDVRLAANVFAGCRRAPELGLAVLSISGGARGVLADACAAEGIALPPFSTRTRERLTSALPSYAVVDNPADLTAEVISRPEILHEVLTIIGEDEATDAVIVQFANQGATQAADVGPLASELARESGKLVALGFIAGLPPQPLVQQLRDAGVLTFDDPAAAVRAFGWLAAHRARARALREAPADPAPAPPEPAIATGWEPFAQLLDRYGIATAPSLTVASEEEARDACRILGLPLVAKLPGDEFAHKTELGGVRVGLADEAAALAAVRDLAGLAGRASPRVQLQRQLPPGVEVLASVRRDPDFGPVLTVGPGGVYVELVAEVAHRLVPAAPAELEAMLDETRLGALLAGFRGAEKGDRAALLQALLGLCRLFEACPWLIEIELNPLIALRPGDGVFAVDVSATVTPPA